MLCYGFRDIRLALRSLFFAILRCKVTHFPRLSSLGFSVTIVRYTEAFCRTTPNADSKEGFDYSFLHSLWISGDKFLNSIRHRVFKLDVSCSDNIFGNEKGGVKKLIF